MHSETLRYVTPAALCNQPAGRSVAWVFWDAQGQSQGLLRADCLTVFSRNSNRGLLLDCSERGFPNVFPCKGLQQGTPLLIVLCFCLLAEIHKLHMGVLRSVPNSFLFSCLLLISVPCVELPLSQYNCQAFIERDMFTCMCLGLQKQVSPQH